MDQWKVFFPEGKLATVGPPLTAETCLQTIHLLDGQLAVYTDDSATWGAKDGGTGAIVTFGDPADPTILHWRSSSHATRIGMGHRQLPRALNYNLHQQSTAEVQAKSALWRCSHDLACQFIAAMGGINSKIGSHTHKCSLIFVKALNILSMGTRLRLILQPCNALLM